MLAVMSALEMVGLPLWWMKTRICTETLKRVEYFISASRSM